MLGHDFIDMPTRSKAGEPENVLRCKWCNKTPIAAREDGCPIHELGEKGSIPLSQFNPGGVGYFKGRSCVTCGAPIMDHYLRLGSPHYWCEDKGNQSSDGITDCVHDVAGIVAPQETTNGGLNDVPVVQESDNSAGN